MFYLDLNLPHLANAKKVHLNKFRCYASRRLGIPGCNLPKSQCSICHSRLQPVTVDPGVLTFLRVPKNLLDILIGDPATLLDVSDRFWISIFPSYNRQTWRPYFDKTNINTKKISQYSAQANLVFQIIRDLKKVLDYDWFASKENSHYNAYMLSESLDRNTCTYCNRSYTSTVILKPQGQLITRPTLDHWFPKSEFPLLAVSFQNLIPSCYSCNSSVKGTVQFNLMDNIHPYVDSSQNVDFQFGYFYATKLNKYRIFIQDSPGKGPKSRDTLKSMFVDEIYNTHDQELEELISIKKNYSKTYIKKIHRLLGQKIPKEEVYRMLFGVYYENTDFHRRPLSKFKYDILKQLDMLSEF